jgi:hypothetical protein
MFIRDLVTEINQQMKTYRRQKRFPKLVKLSERTYRQIKSIKDLVLLPFCLSQVKNSYKTNDIPELISLVMDGMGGVIRPIQDRKEITCLLSMLQQINPQKILEIGTFNGGSLFLFCRVVASDGHIISVDLPGGWFGGGYPKWKYKLYKSFVSGSKD